MSEKTRQSKQWKKIVVALLVIILAASTAFFYKKYSDLKNKPVSADQVAQEEVKRYVEEVGKLYALPKDEEPSVATVKDKDKLQEEPFFAAAENGDVTLIYSNAKLAILYRPSTKQIINVSTVSIQASTRVKVIGSKSAREAVGKLLTTSQVAYTDGGEAEGDYQKTVVVDVSGKNAEQAASIAKALNAQAGTLPEGETKPTDADILIIAGSDTQAP